MNVKTECETKTERNGSEVDQRRSDLISVEDVMMVSFLFICQVRRERRRKIAFSDLASGQQRELLKDHYHLLPLRSCCSGGITLVMRPTWDRLLAASPVCNTWDHILMLHRYTNTHLDTQTESTLELSCSPHTEKHIWWKQSVLQMTWGDFTLFHFVLHLSATF